MKDSSEPVNESLDVEDTTSEVKKPKTYNLYDELADIGADRWERDYWRDS